MDKLVLLKALCAFTEDATKELIMPVKLQKQDSEQQFRAAAVYPMRLPDSTSAQKKAPYIIHQLLNADDSQQSGRTAQSVAVVRSIFCVYNDDEMEGALMLLNLMERVRIPLLEKRIVGKQFYLNLEDTGLEQLIYPDDTAPFFAGEMITKWNIPAVQRTEENALWR